MSNKYAANRIVVLTDEQIKYLKYLLNDRYEDIVEPDATEIKPEEYTIVETHDVLEAALSDNKQRSIMEWHNMDEKPEGMGEVLMKYESGKRYESICPGEFEECKVLYWGTKFELKAIAWAYLVRF